MAFVCHLCQYTGDKGKLSNRVFLLELGWLAHISGMLSQKEAGVLALLLPLGTSPLPQGGT